MNDPQTVAGALLAGLLAIAGAIRWGAGRSAKAQDRGVNALIENARSHATLAAKFDALMSRFESLAARFDHIVESLISDPRMSDSQRQKLAGGPRPKSAKPAGPRADTGTD